MPELPGDEEKKPHEHSQGERDEKAENPVRGEHEGRFLKEPLQTASAAVLGGFAGILGDELHGMTGGAEAACGS